MLAEKMYNGENNFSGGWNFGPNDSDVRNVEWIIKKLCKKWGESSDWIYEKEKSKILHEANYLKLDITKAKNSLNWHPVLNIEETIDFIVEWYKGAENKNYIEEISISQINEYQKKYIST